MLKVYPLIDLCLSEGEPERFPSPFVSSPHPWAVAAAKEVQAWAAAYRAEHPESELHRLGKMMGVLVVKMPDGTIGYLRAFSAMLDGRYDHDGFVEPVYDIATPDGYFKQEEARISAINRQIAATENGDVAALTAERKQRSQALQRWMFGQYKMQNGLGETKDLLQLFAGRQNVLSEEEYFGADRRKAYGLPPSGAGECCAPKLLQAAYKNGLQPICMAEFWVGQSPKNELRREGYFYGACQTKCKPILQFMLQGLNVADDANKADAVVLAKQIDLLYEDDWLCVIDKPSGLAVAAGTEADYTLADWCREKWPDKMAQPAHRLDMDTSGILVIAKDKEILSALQQQFVRRDIKKRYEAVLECPNDRELPEEGVIDLPLLRNPLDRPRQQVNRLHGKAAVTRYKVVGQRSDGYVLVHFFPETGRTHQLRVHAAHPEGLNAPIVGDRLYGRAGERLMLHAAEIGFRHPATGEECHFSTKKALF